MCKISELFSCLSNFVCLSSSLKLAPWPYFKELLKQKILLNNSLLSSDAQDTSHKIMVHVRFLAGKLILG